MMRMEVLSMGDSESDVCRVNENRNRNRNHNTNSIVQSYTDNDSEFDMIDELKRSQRRACSDWENNRIATDCDDDYIPSDFEDNYNFSDLLQ